MFSLKTEIGIGQATKIRRCDWSWTSTDVERFGIDQSERRIFVVLYEILKRLRKKLDFTNKNE